MASPHQYSYPHPPPPAPHQRLPSIKELHFDKVEHARPARHDPARHDWSRPNPPNSGPPSQHSASMSAPHESPKTQYPPTPTPPKAGDAYTSNSMPAPPQTGTGAAGPNGSVSGPSRNNVSSQNASKRPRSGSDVSVSVSPGRSHAAYPQQTTYASQPPPPSFQHGPVPVAPSHEPVHQSAPFTHPPPVYGAYPPPHMTRHYPVPPMPGVHHQHMPPNSYPPPVPPDHWQHQPPPPQVQHQYASFSRTPTMLPANVDPRTGMPPPGEVDKANVRQSTMTEIYQHCRALQQFAHHYAQLQVTQPNAQPTASELQEMNWRASTVVRLIEDLRRMTFSEEDAPREGAPSSLSAPNTAEEHARPPKRPWEDVSREEGDAPPATNTPYPDQGQSQYIDVTDKSTAEADMEIIRSKRATSTGGSAPGQPKSKYRKRSRATPPGKCHSCNIRETPEWRRGPDGARTLCNACGLHYAKLMRKRDKGADGKPTPIDLQTLRASTQSARGSEPEQPQIPYHQTPTQHAAHVQYEQQKQQQQQQRQQQQQQQQQAPPMHPNHHPGGPSPHPHQHPHPHLHQHPGPYQLIPVGAPHPTNNAQAHQMMPPPPPPASHSETGVNVPPPPWMTSSSSSGRSGYSSDHQSYMRASHPPSHARASPP